MQRREFTLAGIAGATAAATGLATLSLPAQAQSASDYTAGKDYMVLRKPAATSAPAGKVEVIEFFGYWCPHCNSFDPEFNAWMKSAPSFIHFRRVPVAFRPEMAPMQRLFYALEAVGMVGRMHGKVFEAYHKQRINLTTDAAILQWAAQQPELKDGRFAQAYQSFGMSAKLNHANQLVEAYAIDGVPSLGVAGKYYLDGQTAKGLTRGIQIATALATQERR